MIAISYRRKDSLLVAVRVCDRLKAEFKRRNVFMDFDSIEAGFDFREQIKQTIRRSKVLIVIIGPCWLGESPPHRRRIDDPDDVVRMEVACGIECDIPIIPVLLDGTPMPRAADLPAAIRQLAQRHALPLDTGLDFGPHVDRLIRSIRKALTKKIASRFHIWTYSRSARRIAAACLTAAFVVAAMVAVVKRTIPNTASAIEDRSIAVMPFENLSEDTQNAYLASGIESEIVNRLSKIRDIKVILRSSTDRSENAPANLRHVREQLSVANVLQGNVQKVGNKVRINVRLSDARTNAQLWNQTYDRKLSEVFEIETEVAQKIADYLQASLTIAEKGELADRPTPSASAYDWYLRGVALIQHSSSEASTDIEAANAFREAVRIDPNFALAWARLARSDIRLYHDEYEATPARLEEATRAINTAMTLQPEKGEVILARAFYQYRIQHDWSGARASFELAHGKLPGVAEVPQALAYLARRQGLWSESLSRFQEACSLDPLNLAVLKEWIATNTALRRFPTAHDLLDRAVKVAPDDLALTCMRASVFQANAELERSESLLRNIAVDAQSDGIVLTHFEQLWLERRFAEAAKLLTEVLGQRGNSTGIENTRYRVFAALARERTGETATAARDYEAVRAELTSLENDRPRSALVKLLMSWVLAGLGKKEEALQKAEQAAKITPTSEDKYVGPVYEINLALVRARVGDSDAAVSALSPVAHRALHMDATPDGGLAPVDPHWDFLRANSKFQQLVNTTP